MIKTILIGLIIATGSFSGAPLGTNVQSVVVPVDSNSPYPATAEEWNRGGYRSVLNETVRDLIPIGYRSVGMLVYCVSHNITYQLQSRTLGNDGWYIYKELTDSAKGIIGNSLRLDTLLIGKRHAGQSATRFRVNLNDSVSFAPFSGVGINSIAFTDTNNNLRDMDIAAKKLFINTDSNVFVNKIHGYSSGIFDDSVMSLKLRVSGISTLGTANIDSLNVHGTVIQKNGYMGVGTSAPSSLVTIDGTSSQSMQFRSGVNIMMRPVSNTYDMRILASGSGANSANTNIDFSEGGTPTTPIMRIVGSGKVGIGATDPESKLTVMGDFTMRNPTTKSRGAWISSGGNNENDKVLQCKSGDSSVNSFTVWSNGNAAIPQTFTADSGCFRAIGRNVRIDSIYTPKTIGGCGSAIDYLAYSTITGWSSYGYSYLNVYKIGKLAHCSFQIAGDSYTSKATFSLPWPSATGNGELFLCRARNGSENGGAFELCTGIVDATAIVSFNPGITGAGTWGIGGTKIIQGSFTYITQ